MIKYGCIYPPLPYISLTSSQLCLLKKKLLNPASVPICEWVWGPVVKHGKPISSHMSSTKSEWVSLPSDSTLPVDPHWVGLDASTSCITSLAKESSRQWNIQFCSKLPVHFSRFTVIEKRDVKIVCWGKEVSWVKVVQQGLSLLRRLKSNFWTLY